MRGWYCCVLMCVLGCGGERLHGTGHRRVPEVLGDDVEITAGGDGDAGPSGCQSSGSDGDVVKARPVDIILVIDNSGSMSREIEAVQDNLDQNFASVLDASGLNYRVIMLSKYGVDGGICIAAPLGGASCSPLPSEPQLGARYFHYSEPIGSHDALCKIVRTYDGAATDEFNLAPSGWRAWLRAEAFKVFIVISDDSVKCNVGDADYRDGDSVLDGEAAAAAFDAALMAKDAAQFGGVGAARNYVWHSIVGMAGGMSLPEEPLLLSVANGARAPGTGYQALSRLTSGLRFSIAGTFSFAEMLQAVAELVDETVSTTCE